MESSTDKKDQLANQIMTAVEGRLGKTDPEIARVVAHEVALALGDQPVDQALMQAAHDRAGETPDRIVVASTGANQPGIVARLSAVIDEFKGDIRDLSQTIVAGYFTMIFVVDISAATKQGTPFATLRERLQQSAAEMGIHVVALHDDILSSMHTV